MDETILARADALMQRRRPAASEADDLPVLTEVASPGEDTATLAEEDDFPVLTAAITSPEPAAPVAAVPVASPPSEAIDALAGEIAGRIERRILAELPRLIDEAVREALVKRGISTSPPRR